MLGVMESSVVSALQQTEDKAPETDSRDLGHHRVRPDDPNIFTYKKKHH